MRMKLIILGSLLFSVASLAGAVSLEGLKPNDKYYSLYDKVRSIKNYEQYMVQLESIRDAKVKHQDEDEKDIMQKYSGKWPDSEVQERFKIFDKRRAEARKEYQDNLDKTKENIRKSVNEIRSERNLKLGQIENRLNDLYNPVYVGDQRRRGVSNQEIESEKSALAAERDEVRETYDTVYDTYKHYLTVEEAAPMTYEQRMIEWTNRQDETERRRQAMDQIKEERQRKEAEDDLKRMKKEADDQYGESLKESESRLKKMQQESGESDSGTSKKSELEKALGY